MIDCQCDFVFLLSCELPTIQDIFKVALPSSILLTLIDIVTIPYSLYASLSDQAWMATTLTQKLYYSTNF